MLASTRKPACVKDADNALQSWSSSTMTRIACMSFPRCGPRDIGCAPQQHACHCARWLGRTCRLTCRRAFFSRPQTNDDVWSRTHSFWVAQYLFALRHLALRFFTSSGRIRHESASFPAGMSFVTWCRRRHTFRTSRRPSRDASLMAVGKTPRIPYRTPSDLTLRHSRARSLMSIPQSGRARDR